jgi:purine-binding chemotaxis protein CheW
MRWRQDFVRCVGRRDEDPIIVPDLNRVFAAAGDPNGAAVVTPMRPTA